MNVALFGGTFDPVHVGHLFLAEEVKFHFNFDRIIFVPANIPVHKDARFQTNPKHRMKMLEIATATYPGFYVDDCELRRGGNSYTIDTVHEILKKNPVESKPGLIIGDDLVETFHAWKGASLLADMVNLIIVHRKSTEQVQMDFACTYVENSLLPVSSSEIRERLKAGKSIRCLVPEKVIRYIRKHGLYVEMMRE